MNNAPSYWEIIQLSYISNVIPENEYTKINNCPSCRKTIMASSDSHIYAQNEIYMYERCNN